MANPTLLADLALRLAQSPEDVATEALTLILGRSEASRQALNGLLVQWAGSTSSAVARWKAQVVGADDSRTDMEGEDALGAVRVILENKFWAGLTPNQPATYLRRLPEDGVLAFVAPTARLTSLLVELLDRAAVAGFGRLEFHGLGDSRVAKISAQQTLVITSWDAILKTIASALELAQDHTALADIRQLQGLAEKMDTEGFVPLSATDITGPTPRHVMQFIQIVNEAWTLFSRLPSVSSKGLRISAGAGWYGPYMAVHGYACQFIFSADRWARFGVSPVWFQVAVKRGNNVEDRVQVSLASLLHDPSWLRTEAGNRVRMWMPLRLLEGREKDTVVDDLVTQLTMVANVLATHAVSATHEEDTIAPDAAVSLSEIVGLTKSN